jgi:hypothetical protein
MNVKLTAASLGLVVSMSASAVSAHHSFAAEFDVNKPVSLRGQVVKMEWINPHSWIHVAVVDDETGEMHEWMIECGPPNGLIRRGFTKASLLPGTEIVVDGWQARDDSYRANGSSLTLTDGTRLFLGSSNKAAPGAAK